MSDPAPKDAARDLRDARERTLALVEPLSDAELAEQHSPLLSPLLWDLGHVGAFEELWLLRDDGRTSRLPGSDALFDPFGTPRPGRGALGLPSREETLAFLDDVRREALELVTTDTVDRRLAAMVASHETQHQETMLQSLDLRERSYAPAARREMHARAPEVDDERRITVPAGAFDMGAANRGFAYDNERPRRRVDVQRFAMDAHPVTCRRWLRFTDDGGYERRDVWTEAGLRWRDEARPEAPQGWTLQDGRWHVRRFGHHAPLDPREPVQHVSAHEADAFARWAGGRLPTEAEWEKAAGFDPVARACRHRPWGEAPPAPRHANLSRGSWGPVPVGSRPDGASPLGFMEMLGDVYQWTSDELDTHPGFVADPYPGYTEAFFGRGYRVLRGASWAAGPPLARCSYRNWDLPERRQIFAGLRLAWAA